MQASNTRNAPASRARLALGASALALGVLLSGCTAPKILGDWQPPFLPAKEAPPPAFSQESLPAAVQVSRSFQVAFETVGRGEVTYQCRPTAAGTSFAWVFVKPVLKLSSRAGEPLIDYEGPPATFAHKDGSIVTAAPLAAAPQSPGNLPYQVFAANRANMLGAMMGVTHVQRVANIGGVAPSTPCNAQNFNAWARVPFQADYIFYRSL